MRLARRLASPGITPPVAPGRSSPAVLNVSTAPRSCSRCTSGRRAGLQASLDDRPAAVLADPVSAVVQLRERVVDLLDGPQRLGRQGQVTLPVDGDGPPLARFVVELDVARLHLLDKRLRLGFQAGCLLEIGGTLAQERGPLVREKTLLFCIAFDGTLGRRCLRAEPSGGAWGACRRLARRRGRLGCLRLGRLRGLHGARARLCGRRLFRRRPRVACPGLGGRLRGRGGRSLGRGGRCLDGLRARGRRLGCRCLGGLCCRLGGGLDGRFGRHRLRLRRHRLLGLGRDLLGGLGKGHHGLCRRLRLGRGSSFVRRFTCGPGRRSSRGRLRGVRFHDDSLLSVGRHHGRSHHRSLLSRRG